MNENKKLMQEGFKAFFSETPCPYESGGLKYNLWKQGWAIAFDAFFNIDGQGSSNGTHFYREDCCIVELLLKGHDHRDVTVNHHGPFKDRAAAEGWTEQPENKLDDYRYSYRITPLKNPDE